MPSSPPAVPRTSSQGNLACTYEKAGRLDEALSLRQEVYSARLKLNGEEDQSTITAANNYADSLRILQRFEEAKALLRKWIPKARRVLGEGHRLTLMMSMNYARALIRDPDATLDDIREAVTTLEETQRIARRVFGGAHPLTEGIEDSLRRVCETRERRSERAKNN